MTTLDQRRRREWAREHEDLITEMQIAADRPGADERIADLLSDIEGYGSLSDAQLRLARSLLSRVKWRR